MLFLQGNQLSQTTQDLFFFFKLASFLELVDHGLGNELLTLLRHKKISKINQTFVFRRRFILLLLYSKFQDGSIFLKGRGQLSCW